MFLLGFIHYIKFLKTGRSLFLFTVILFFLIGMLNYETFFLWPFTIVIFASIEYLRGEGELKKKRLARTNLLILGSVYAAYFLVFIFTRSLNTYGNPPREIFDFLKLESFITTIFMVLFNLGYNIIIDILPLLSFPLKVAENIYLAGPIVNFITKGYSEIVFVGGGFIGILLILFSTYLYKKQYIAELKTLWLFLFLILSETYTVFLPRVVINTFEYSLTEFRYQYIPNAFMVLSFIFIIDRFLIFSKKKAKIIFFILLPLLALNIYCGQRIMNVYNQHFVNLKKMLSSIKSGIHKGIITSDNKIYIAEDLPEYLPSLCWNVWMGERFIKEGNYKWMFSKEQFVYFARSYEEATWIIDKENFDLIKKYPPKIFKKTKNVGLGKDMQYVDLGNFYLGQKEYDRSRNRFERAIAINPNNDCAYHGFGVYYLTQKQYEKARIMFKRAVKINPKYAQPYADLGHLLNRKREYKKAEEMFKKTLAIDIATDGAYEGLATCYMGQERYKEAEEMFKKALKINSSHAWIYADMGHLYNAQKRYTEAEKMFKKAIRIDRDNYDAYAGLATCYMSQKRYQDAETMFKKAITVDSNNTWSYIDLGHLYNAQKRYKEAEKMFNEVIKIDDNIAGAYQGLGSCYIGQKRYQDAETMFKKAIEIDSDFVQSYIDIGYLYNSLKRYKEAEKMFNEIIRIDRDNYGAYAELATCYIEQKRYQDAETMFKKAITVDSNNTWSYIDLGHLYNAQKRYKEAEKMFKKAIAIDPGNESAYDGLKTCYREQGRDEGAEQIIIKSKFDK